MLNEIIDNINIFKLHALDDMGLGSIKNLQSFSYETLANINMLSFVVLGVSAIAFSSSLEKIRKFNELHWLLKLFATAALGALVSLGIKNIFKTLINQIGRWNFTENESLIFVNTLLVVFVIVFAFLFFYFILSQQFILTYSERLTQVLCTGIFAVLSMYLLLNGHSHILDYIQSNSIGTMVTFSICVVYWLLVLFISSRLMRWRYVSDRSKNKNLRPWYDVPGIWYIGKQMRTDPKFNKLHKAMRSFIIESICSSVLSFVLVAMVPISYQSCVILIILVFIIWDFIWNRIVSSFFKL
jgi:hypothetical protein